MQHTLDEFAGTFAISDHDRIPEVLVEYLIERFYAKVDNKWLATRKHILSNISLEDINQALNEVWQGPGSLDTVRAYIAETRGARLSEIVDSQPTNKKAVAVPTLDSDLKVTD
jgi:hypothetical protein